MDLDDLRVLWAKHMGKKTPPKIKSLLLRDLAWQMQKKTHGGLDEQTQSLLNAAIRQAANLTSLTSRKTKTPSPIPKPVLQTGTQLIREWQGRKHEVTVLNDGKYYEYQSKTYRSLSKIAKEITGAHWSGPRFFGLNKVRSVK